MRWISILVGVAVIGFAVLLVAKGFAPPKPIGAGDGGFFSSDAALDAGATAAIANDSGAPSLFEPPTWPSILDAGIDIPAGDAGTALGLPESSPKEVRFGVVLVTYAGAQGAPAGARTHAAASELADKLAKEASSDFHGTIQKGDPGSDDDMGRISRGFLEPRAEYALFTLPVGGVSAPVDTPRGFWILKRLE